MLIGVFVQRPLGSLQTSVVHRSVSPHMAGVPGSHVPDMQRSPPLQARVSSQGVPSAVNAFAGQMAASPLQLSAGSQKPEAARH